jgi:hypothetical protein
MGRSEQPIKVFFSYSHRDEELRQELKDHLSLLINDGVIKAWDDRDIEAGSEWETEIKQELEQADIILLLISKDFLASRYCYCVEMERALERHGKREAEVIPIILRDCEWEKSRFAHLQCLPRDGKHVTSWPDRDKVFADIAREIRRKVEGKIRDAKPDSRPKVAGKGSLVYRLCDRAAQEDEFYIFLHLQSRNRPGWPQICLTRGTEEECPGGLVERLTRTSIQGYADGRWGEQRGAVTFDHHNKITWPEAGEPEERLSFLIGRVLRQWGRQPGNLSPADFARAFDGMIDPLIVLSHEIYAGRWQQAEKELLDEYLRFWDEVGRCAPKPQFIVFLNLLYPQEERGSGWWARLRRAGFDREQLGRELREMVGGLISEQSCPKLLLKELGCIEWPHVRDWFNRHGIFDEGEWQRWRRELFRDKTCRPMAEIERELKRIHREFINQ